MVCVRFEDAVRAKLLTSTFSFLLSLTTLLFANPAAAQMHAYSPQQGPPQGPPQRVDPGMTPPQGEEARDRAVREMAKKANQERQAALKNDTEKLVKLAGELKQYVDKSNENMLSLDVVKKAEEIEKLAKSVREKMRGAN
jgi:hypothetical protein